MTCPAMESLNRSTGRDSLPIYPCPQPGTFDAVWRLLVRMARALAAFEETIGRNFKSAWGSILKGVGHFLDARKILRGTISKESRHGRRPDRASAGRSDRRLGAVETRPCCDRHCHHCGLGADIGFGADLRAGF